MDELFLIKLTAPHSGNLIEVSVKRGPRGTNVFRVSFADLGVWYLTQEEAATLKNALLSAESVATTRTPLSVIVETDEGLVEFPLEEKDK